MFCASLLSGLDLCWKYEFEKACNPALGFNIPMDCVAGGAGKAAPRRPKSFLNHLFSDPIISLVRTASARILAGKMRISATLLS